jgi:hypothetical protein
VGDVALRQAKVDVRQGRSPTAGCRRRARRLVTLVSFVRLIEKRQDTMYLPPVDRRGSPLTTSTGRLLPSRSRTAGCRCLCSRCPALHSGWDRPVSPCRPWLLLLIFACFDVGCCRQLRSCSHSPLVVAIFTATRRRACQAFPPQCSYITFLALSNILLRHACNICQFKSRNSVSY